MKHYEVSIDVEPIDMGVVDRLKAAGHRVYRGPHHWRIVATAPAIGQDSVRSQAHVLVNDILADYALTPTTQPPTCTLRDPDAGLDDRPDLLLHDTLKAYEPDPLERPRRRWWQSAMERGFAERDSD